MQMRWVVMVGLIVLASARLTAHDFWLAATPWDPGAQVTISANLGEIFPVATDRVVAEGVDRWRVLGPGGEVHLDTALRNDGRVLTADVQLPAPPSARPLNASRATRKSRFGTALAAAPI